MGRVKGRTKQRRRNVTKSLNKHSAIQRKNSLLRMIKTFDDPVLKKICIPVKDISELDCVKQIRQVLSATDNGIGLAAPQIGICKKIVAIRPDIKLGKIRILVNPEILDLFDDPVDVTEGCLSYPGVYCQVKRHKKITVQYVDESFENKKSVFRNMEAIIVQHEVDHISNPPVCYVGEHWGRNQKKDVA